MHAHWALAVVLTALGCAASQPETPLVASGNEFAITLDELDAEIRERLFLEKTRGGDAALVYELRSETLDSMVRNQVLATESERRSISVDELIASETPPVSDADVEAFFEENKTRMEGAKLEDVADRIRDFLGQQNAVGTVTALVDAAGVEIALEPPRFDVEAIGPSRGPVDAPITIVEFSDFQCPYCSRAIPILNELLARHPEDIRLVYRHLPLESMHPRARPAAIASGCADDQDKFWVYHDNLFAKPGQLTDADLTRIATESGLELEAYEACYAARTPEARVNADIEAARVAGLTSTPAFLVNGRLVKGAVPVEEFESVIASELQRIRNPAP